VWILQQDEEGGNNRERESSVGWDGCGWLHIETDATILLLSTDTCTHTLKNMHWNEVRTVFNIKLGEVLATCDQLPHPSIRHIVTVSQRQMLQLFTPVR
jgi:hypothetical protein